jgi:hypothetical protein
LAGRRVLVCVDHLIAGQSRVLMGAGRTHDLQGSVAVVGGPGEKREWPALAGEGLYVCCVVLVLPSMPWLRRGLADRILGLA